MKFIVSQSRHVAMICGRLEILKSFAVILTIMLADVTVIGGKITVDMGLEGSITDHDVIVGSNINLTCKPMVTPKTSCSTLWLKNSKRLKESTEDNRIRLLLGEHVSDSHCSASKLVIKNFGYSDGGKYECVVVNAITEFQTENAPRAGVDIHAVACYQGFYCPNTGRKTAPRRCPSGTFTRNNNGTSIEDCLTCPKDTNEREKWIRRMESKTIQMFQTNCYSSFLSQAKDGTSNLSSHLKAAIITVPIVATLMVVIGVLYGFHRRKVMNKYRVKLLSPFKEVDYDPPKMTRSKDVFVCYSSKNREWVHATLFPNLRSQDFKVFIDFVDFEIGKSIDENIVKGIYGSRKTLFILSNDSLKSLYARKELYHALAAGKTGHQVLVILYEKCKAPAEIADFVYLDWADEKNRDRFWERLYGAIRRPLANEIVHV